MARRSSKQCRRTAPRQLVWRQATRRAAADSGRPEDAVMCVRKPLSDLLSSRRRRRANVIWEMPDITRVSYMCQQVVTSGLAPLCMRGSAGR